MAKCKPKHYRYWRKGKWLCANCHQQVRWFANTLGWVHWQPKGLKSEESNSPYGGSTTGSQAYGVGLETMAGAGEVGEGNSGTGNPGRPAVTTAD